MDDEVEVWEFSPNDLEVEAGKRVTIHGVEGLEIVLDDRMVDEIVRQWLDLPPGTTRGELIDGVLEGFERNVSDESDESE